MYFVPSKISDQKLPSMEQVVVKGQLVLNRDA